MATHATKRQRDVLCLVAQGYTNKEIARRLCLAPSTVKNYLFVVFRRYDATNRTAAVLSAMQCGDIPLTLRRVEETDWP